MVQLGFENKASRAGINYLTESEEKKLFSFLKNRKDKQAERDYVLLRLCRSGGGFDGVKGSIFLIS